MLTQTNIGSGYPVGNDWLMSTMTAQPVILEAARFRNTDAGQRCCPECHQNYLQEELICPRCGSINFDNTKTVAFSGSVNEFSALVKQPVGEASAVQKPIVFEVNGARLKLPSASSLVVGSAGKEASDPQPDVNLNLFNAEALGVSCQHVKILSTHDVTYLSDMGSKNGTFLNAHPLAPGTQSIVRDRDELRLGNLKVRVRFSTSFSSLYARLCFGFA